MEVDEEPKLAPLSSEKHSRGLDSDDETLRFDQDDDLYGSDLDEVDARWVRKQHRPAAECDEENPANEDGRASEDRGDDDNNMGGLPPEVADNDADAKGDARHQGQGQGNRGRGGSMDVASDAQLSCPLCFTTVCLECQRHARYHNQFRAVTGINITVNYDESLTFDDVSGAGKRPRKGGKGARNRGRTAQQLETGRRGVGETSEGSGGGGGEERFHPVCCRECDHRVGVLDEEEVFHFFSIIASG